MVSSTNIMCPRNTVNFFALVHKHIMFKYYEIMLFGWDLWYKSSCRLFTAKSCLYIYILNIWFMNVYFVENIFKQELIHLHSVKWFQVFPTNMNLQLNICSLTVNGFKYRYLTLIIPSNINHLFAHS